MRRPAGVVVMSAVVAAGVLAVDPKGWSPFGPSKWLAVSGLALLGVALMAWSRRHRPLAVSRRAMLAWGGFLVWATVAAAGGVDRLYAWMGTPQRHFGLFTWVLCGLVFVAGHAIDDEGDARLVVSVTVATAGVAGAWAVVEQLGWQPVAVDAGNRLVGSMGSAAFLGAATALLTPVAIGIAIDRSWSPAARWGAAVSATLAGAALIGSGARAAWFATVVVAALVLKRNVIHRPKRAAAVGAAALVVVLGAGAVMGVAGRVPAAFDHSQAGGSSRVDEWRVAVRVLAHHPLTGVGPASDVSPLRYGQD